MHKLLVAALLAAASPQLAAQADNYPTKAIRVVVPYPPGAGTDLHARALAERMTESLGQQVIVDNRSGANGIPAMEHAARSAPDLPAIGEMFPGYSADFWFGMWAPAGTPRAVIVRINQALARILKQPDVQERLRTDSLQAVGSTPDEFARAVARDIATWSKVVKAGNIKLN